VSRYLFPRWANKVPFAIVVALGGAATMLIAAIWYYGTDKYWKVGYQPAQPIEFSHKLHAGDLGMDCRYCHNTVERSSYAAIPPTQTCMNCHSKVKTDSPKLAPLYESNATGNAVPWVKVHSLPDYAYFDHSAHVTAGVGCSTCHGRIDQMPRVTHFAPLTMAWCLDCHRNPGPNIRNANDITKMDWQPSADAPKTTGPVLTANGREANPPKHCSGCHR